MRVLPQRGRAGKVDFRSVAAHAGKVDFKA
ncbi:hypothetical protein GGD83_003769 [Rhodoblastus sphagnicola]|nr:hypothetical protein [Rhodoblastus sphagnicola]